MAKLPTLDKAAPTLFAAVVTGIFASLMFMVATVLDGLFLTPDSVVPLILVILISGFVVGIIMLWPLFYICSAMGLMLAASQPWAQKRLGWAMSGAGIGGLSLSALALSQSEPLPLLFFAAYGAVCGTLAGILCHRWILGNSLFVIDAQE